MIKILSLENWKTHYRTNLQFEKGTNVIVGKMGSGKSSVLDAISFALYGTFPGVNGRKVTLEETIMAKPSKQDSSAVKLEFDYNGKNYLVERIIKRSGTNEGYLRENGSLIAGPKTSDVTKKVSEILESDYDLFNRAIYSEQNQIDFFLRMSPSLRKEKLDELLGLDRYESARSNSVTLASKMKRNADEKKKFAQEQKAKNDLTKIAEYEKKISEKKKHAHEKEQALNEISLRLSQNLQTLQKLENDEKTHRTLNEKLVGTKIRAESIQSQLKAGMEKLAGHDSAKTAQLAAEKKDEIEKNRILLEENETQRKEMQNLIISLKEQRATEKSLLDECQRRQTSTQSLTGQCTVCKKPLSTHDKEKLMLELSEEKIFRSEKIADIERKIFAHSGKFVELENSQKNLRQKREKIQKEFFELEKNQATLLEMGQKKEQISLLESEALLLEEQIKNTKFDRNALDELRKKILEDKTGFAREKSELSGITDLVAEFEKSLKMIKDSQESIAKLEQDAQDLERRAEKLSMFTSALRATQGELRNVMIENINYAMQEIWPRVYPYNDLLGVKVLVEDGNYEIAARQRSGEWIRVEGILSGGERSSVAITLRIALSLVLTQNLGWIMLDEPTHNLDSAAVRELCATLGSKLPELIDQIFIITHDKEMENAASGKLYVFEREKENDGATKIV